MFVVVKINQGCMPNSGTFYLVLELIHIKSLDSL